MEPRISLITLGVTDLARARAFYEALGFRSSPVSNESVAFYQAGGVVLALWSRADLAEDAHIGPEGEGFSGIVLAHNVREREQVGAVLDEVRAVGGAVLKAAADTVWGGRAGYFADPDGHVWEVAWNPGFAILADGAVRLPD